MGYQIATDDINVSNGYSKTSCRFEKSRSAINKNASRPIAYLTFLPKS